MPNDHPADSRLLCALDLAVFERQAGGLFAATGPLPAWFQDFRAGSPAGDLIDLVEIFPFLEVFLPECEEVWTSAAAARAQSDVWTERDHSGRDLHLQAVAVRVAGRPLLVIDSPAGAYHERSVALQRAHDVALQSEKIERLSRELARVNRELTERNQEVERATRAKSDFLAGMSHEIRTPMNAILGMADLLSRTPLTEEQKQYVAVFQRAGNHLLSLIDDILDLSKVESGRLELEAVEFDLREVLGKALELIAVRATAKGLAVRHSIGPGVPVSLIGDPNRLRQVLINLLGNSMKFTESGSLEVTVTLNPEDSGPGALLFAVADTGIGIPEDKLEAIFENFTQADTSTTRKYGGTGLGLSISRRLVELMGGRIWVQSKPGAGSTFFFTARFALGTAESGVPAAARSDFEAIRLDGLSILVADDSEDNRFLILSYLKDTGCIVDLAENGAVALSRFDSQRYDIVLMDVEMPVADGYTAVRRIRELEGVRGSAPVPVLALTAHALSESKSRSLEAGFTAHLTKPVRRAVLLEAIRRHVPDLGQEPAPKRIRVPIDPMLQAIVPAFLEKRRNEVLTFLDALDREDFDEIRVLGHNLKGCGAGYGFPPLSKMGAAIEKAAEQRNRGEIRARVGELARYLEAVEPQYPG